MADNWIIFPYVDNIFLDDWPLSLLDKWIKSITNANGYIHSDFYEVIDPTFVSNEAKTSSDLKSLLSERCCQNSSMCRRTQCGSRCFTAGNIKQKLKLRNLDKYSGLINEEEAQWDILFKYFDNITYKIPKIHIRTRIGILLFKLPEPTVKGIASLQNRAIHNQLSTKYYVSCAQSIVPGEAFSCIKQRIDTVVIITDSNTNIGTNIVGDSNNNHHSVNDGYSSTNDNSIMKDDSSKNRHSNKDGKSNKKANSKKKDKSMKKDVDICSIVKRFRYLKVFLLKTTDNIDEEFLKSSYQTFFPNNSVEVYDWIYNPDGLPDHISKCLTPKKRISVAFKSLFMNRGIGS